MKIPEANLRNMLSAISAGNHVLNEKVRFYTSTNSQCPDCEYDPVRKESTNSSCPTCGGTGSITTYAYKEIDCSVETEKDFQYDFKQAGKITKGQIFVTVDIKEINEVLNLVTKYDLNDAPQMKALLNQYDYIWWKGAKYTIESYEPGWLQGNLYEIALVLSLMD